MQLNSISSSSSLFHSFIHIQPPLKFNLSLNSGLSSTPNIRRLYDEINNKSNKNKIWSEYLRCIESDDVKLLPKSLHDFILRNCLDDPSRKYNKFHIERFVENQSRLRFIIDTMNMNNQKPNLDDYKFILKKFSNMGSRSGVRRVVREIIESGFKLDLDCYNLIFNSYVKYINRFQKIRPKNILPIRIVEAEVQGKLNEMAINDVKPNQLSFNYILSILKDCKNFDSVNNLLLTSYGIDLNNPDNQPIEFKEFLNNNPDFDPPTCNRFVLRTILDAIGNKNDLSTLISAFEMLHNPIITPKPQTYIYKPDEVDNVTNSVSVSGKNLSFHVFDKLFYHLCRIGPTFLVQHYINLLIHYYDQEYNQLSKQRRSTLVGLRNKMTSKSIKDVKLSAPQLFFSASLLNTLRVGVLHSHAKKTGIITFTLNKIDELMYQHRREIDHLNNFIKQYESLVMEILIKENVIQSIEANEIIKKVKTDLKFFEVRVKLLSDQNKYLDIAKSTWLDAFKNRLVRNKIVNDTNKVKEMNRMIENEDRIQNQKLSSLQLDQQYQQQRKQQHSSPQQEQPLLL